MADVKVRIVGEDKASREIQKVDKSLQGLKTSAAEASGKSGFGAMTASIKGALGVLAVASTAMVAFGIAAKKAFDFTQEGAQLMRLEASGDSLAASLGGNLESIIAKLKETSFNTISTADAIRAANRAMMLGLGADADKLGQLMEIAAFRGRAMGLSTTQAFSDIVTGIGRMSPLILDNLGLVIDMDARVREWAEANGVAAGSIDAATKKQILLNDVLAEGKKQIEAAGGMAQDTAGEFEELSAAWDDFIDSQKRSLAEGLGGPGEIAEMLRGITETQRLNKALREAFEAGKITYAQWSEIASVANDKTLESEVAFNMLDAAIYRVTDEFLKLKDADMIGEMEQVAPAAIRAAQAIDQMARASQFERGKPLQSLIDERAIQQMEEAEKAIREVDSAAKDLWSTVSKEPTSFIENLLTEIEWVSAGGGQLTAAAQQIGDAVMSGKISPQEGRAYLEEIFLATQDLQTELGNITADEAAANIEATLGWTLKGAKEYIIGTNGIQGALGAITSRPWFIEIQFKYQNPPPGWFGQGGGGPVTLPPGSPFPPRRQDFGSGNAPGGGESKGGTTIMIPAINIYTTPQMDEFSVASVVVQELMNLGEADRSGAFAGLGYAG